MILNGDASLFDLLMRVFAPFVLVAVLMSFRSILYKYEEMEERGRALSWRFHQLDEEMARQEREGGL